MFSYIIIHWLNINIEREDIHIVKITTSNAWSDFEFLFFS
jgi:hypothetical protein